MQASNRVFALLFLAFMALLALAAWISAEPAPADPSVSRRATETGEAADTRDPGPAEPDRTAKAAQITAVTVPAPADVHGRLIFAAGKTIVTQKDISGAGGALLQATAARLTEEPALGLHIFAYAGTAANNPARRLSLKRALVLREALIDMGVPAQRIKVRALGNKGGTGPPDRVDLVFVAHGSPQGPALVPAVATLAGAEGGAQTAQTESPGPQKTPVQDKTGDGAADGFQKAHRVAFKPGSADLGAEALAVLRQVAQTLKQDPAIRAVIQGYAARSPVVDGAAADGTQRLSLDRAYLQDVGIAGQRFQIRALGTSGGAGPADRVEVALFRERPSGGAAQQTAPGEETRSHYSVAFAPGGADLTEEARAVLSEAASVMLGKREIRSQVLAYAEGQLETANSARRLSLSRALVVRGFLIDLGIPSTRMQVRALGHKSGEGPPDRVDLLFLDKTAAD